MGEGRRRNPARKIRSFAIDPADPATMYIGTEPAGLLISDNEGETWRDGPARAKCSDELVKKWIEPTIKRAFIWISSTSRPSVLKKPLVRATYCGIAELLRLA